MNEVLASLGLNWKLFLAQLINFSVVLFVLWKWAFTPLSIALEKRRQAIAKGLEDSKAAMLARSDSEAAAGATMATARREAQRLIEEATASGEKLRNEAKEKAKADVAQVVAEGKAMLESEKQKMVLEAKGEIADLVVATAAKVIGESMDEKSKKAMLDSAVKKMLS